jgi:VIT1/CCC1 family predicted Fe2+/Mn2+ transporter
VSSQADTEQADLARERQELAADPASELAELTSIYVDRGLDPSLASQVAEQLTEQDALAAHSRDELGTSEMLVARPIQAALASAGTFAVGAALPLLAVLVAPESYLIQTVAASSLIFLAALGGLAAVVGGASAARGAIRVTFWGALAMALTAGVGTLFGTVV